MLDLLMHIHKSPNLHHKPVLIRYDSETSRRVITGQWHVRDINLVPLVSIIRNVLNDLNDKRRAQAEQCGGGMIARSAFEANKIGWQWVKAHNKDLGNDWVDARAKSGADKYSAASRRPAGEEHRPYLVNFPVPQSSIGNEGGEHHLETEVQLQNPILEEQETALLSNRRQDHILVALAMDSSHVVMQLNLLEDFVGIGNQLCDRDSTVGSSIGGSDIDAMEEDSIDN